MKNRSMNECKKETNRENKNKTKVMPELYAWVQKISDPDSILANIQLQSGGSLR